MILNHIFVKNKYVIKNKIIMKNIYVAIITLNVFLLNYSNTFGQFCDGLCTSECTVEWICNFEDCDTVNTSYCLSAERSLPDLDYVVEINGIIDTINSSGCIDISSLNSGDTLSVIAFNYDLDGFNSFLEGAFLYCTSPFLPTSCEYQFGIPMITDILITFHEGSNDDMPGLNNLQEALDFAKEISPFIDINGVIVALEVLNSIIILTLDPVCYAGTSRTYYEPVLPVELQSFVGFSDDCTIKLNWETGSERNFSHFEIEKSYDGVDFQTIGRIDSKGEDNGITGGIYDYADANPMSINYYRLRIVDIDNTFTYSDIIIVKSECIEDKETTIINVYPNPVKGDKLSVEVFSNSNINNAKVHITDQLGRVINKTNTLITKDFNTIEIDIDNLNTHAIYFLVIKGDQWSTRVTKFIKSGQ